MPALTDREINHQANNILAFLRRTVPPADAALILTTLVAKYIAEASVGGDVESGVRVFTATLITTLATQETEH